MSEPFQDTCKNNGWAARFTCPGCYTDLDFDQHNGKQFNCPKCDRKITCYVEHEPVSVCDLLEDDDE